MRIYLYAKLRSNKFISNKASNSSLIINKSRIYSNNFYWKKNQLDKTIIEKNRLDKKD